MAEEGCISVAVLYSPAAREVHEWVLTLPAGACVLQALRASGVLRLVPDAELAKVPLGIWGRPARLDAALRQGDRVEIYRPLQVDPKLARRERFRKQGVRAAGLFARRKSDTGSGS
jgi:putative ubiquitin-RnfH superfamily antitoxin RatB of RatAB toxin-antitoxin module